MKQGLIIIAVLLFGCQSYNGLYIDDSCTAREVELIEIAVEKLNTAVDEEVVVLNGVVKGGDDDRKGVGDNSRDVVFCFDADTDEGKLRGYDGRLDSDDILIRRRGHDDIFLYIMMHELGHYAFGAYHLSDPNSIMCKKNCDRSVTEYSRRDILEFERSI